MTILLLFCDCQNVKFEEGFVCWGVGGGGGGGGGVKSGQGAEKRFLCVCLEMGEKLVGERPKTKLAESKLLKRINCYSIKMN